MSGTISRRVPRRSRRGSDRTSRPTTTDHRARASGSCGRRRGNLPRAIRNSAARIMQGTIPRRAGSASKSRLPDFAGAVRSGLGAPATPRRTITATTADRLQTTGRGAFRTAAAITTAPIRGLMAATTSDRVSRKRGSPPRHERAADVERTNQADDDGGGAPARPDVGHDQGAPPITTPRRRGAATRAAPWTADGTPGGPRRAAAALCSLTRW